MLKWGGGWRRAALESHFNLTFKHLFSISCGSVRTHARTRVRLCAGRMVAEVTNPLVLRAAIWTDLYGGCRVQRIDESQLEEA